MTDRAMNALLLRLCVLLLIFGTTDVIAYDPCPVCGGKVTALENIKDDLRKPSKNDYFFNRSHCGGWMLEGAVICTRCWIANRWYEEKWERGSSLPDTFIPPLDKSIRDFPALSAKGEYMRVFEGVKMSDSREIYWDEANAARLDRYLAYAKEHDLMMELHGALSPAGSYNAVTALTGEKKVNPAEVRFYGDVYLIVQAKPKVLYEKPLPPRRPVELRTAKAEYLRSAEALRTRYVNELLQMLRKAEKENDGVAKTALGRELKAAAVPKDSDTKELTKLLMGTWKSKTYAPIWRGDGVWHWGLKEEKEESAPWRVEGNELLQTYPKREGSDEIMTRRFTILLLTKTQFLYLEESKSDDYVTYRFESWEKSPETERR